MAKTVSVIGVDPSELVWVRSVLSLLRHPDPVVCEMVRQALLYLERNAQENGQFLAEPIDNAVSGLAGY